MKFFTHTAPLENIGIGRFGCKRFARAFTLIELLVVIAIIGILVSLTIAGVTRALNSARTTQSSSQMRQISSAAMLWAIDNKGRLPTIGGGQQDPWYVATYPYIYEKAAPNPFFDSWEKAENLRGTVYYCPLKDGSGEGPPIRSYAWNTFLKDMSQNDRPPLYLDRLRSPSMTMMLATSRRSSVMDGQNSSVWNFSTRTGGKVLIVFCDGHVGRKRLEEIPVDQYDIFWRPE